jgi:hypothetical protein
LGQGSIATGGLFESGFGQGSIATGGLVESGFGQGNRLAGTTAPVILPSECSDEIAEIPVPFANIKVLIPKKRARDKKIDRMELESPVSRILCSELV